MDKTQGKPKRVGVQLGRFAPYHIGHQMVTKAMLEKHGPENCMVMVGSSNALNYRTPFSYEQRKNMINTVFPEIKVVPMPDVKPELVQFDGTSNKVWLKQIMKIEEQYGADFVFYGGAAEDLEVLGILFDTEVIVDRKTEGLDLSATNVRETIKSGNIELLGNQLTEKVAEIVITSMKLNGISL